MFPLHSCFGNKFNAVEWSKDLFLYHTVFDTRIYRFMPWNRECIVSSALLHRPARVENLNELPQQVQQVLLMLNDFSIITKKLHCKGLHWIAHRSICKVCKNSASQFKTDISFLCAFCQSNFEGIIHWFCYCHYSKVFCLDVRSKICFHLPLSIRFIIHWQVSPLALLSNKNLLSLI